MDIFKQRFWSLHCTALLAIVLGQQSLAQNQTVNGNLNVSGTTYSASGIGLGTTTNYNSYEGRKWWSKMGTGMYNEFSSGYHGSSSALVFNGYTTGGISALEASGNIAYAVDAGQYGNGAGLIKYTGNGGTVMFMISDASSGIGNPVVWNNVMTLFRNQRAVFYGNVGIGTANPQTKLAVNGNIRAKEVKVETANWPDYVFEENYALPDLNELSAYINANKHLPGLPSAKEAEAEGIDLGEMNRLLLEKVEELTLHAIDQQKQMHKMVDLILRLAEGHPISEQQVLEIKK